MTFTHFIFVKHANLMIRTFSRLTSLTDVSVSNNNGQQR